MSTNFTTVLDALKQNKFDPATNHETIIPDQPGNYILCLKPNSNFPTASIIPELTEFEGLKVIYTGKTKVSLRKRDYKQHFTGNNAGRSTLRKSLGVLLGYKQIPRDKNPSNGKTKFGNSDEEKLSDWMCKNLILFFLPTSDFSDIEIDLINHFNPPLNLQSNHNHINADFRELLSALRNSK